VRPCFRGAELYIDEISKKTATRKKVREA